MQFDLDPVKDAKIRAERGFGLLDAAAIFLGDVVEWQDTREAYPETRMVAIGRAHGAFFTVVYTDRGADRRLITAWPSHRKERARWLKEFGSP